VQWTVKRIRRSAVALSLSAVVLGGTAACGQDDPEPEAENRPTEAETTAAAVKDETPEKFIRRWLNASKAMQNTGDTTDYLAMSQNCANCKEVAERVRSYYDAGGGVSFQGHDIKSIEPYSNEKNRFLVKCEVGPTAYRTASAAPEQHFDGGREDYVVTLEMTVDGWQVLESTVLVR